MNFLCWFILFLFLVLKSDFILRYLKSAWGWNDREKREELFDDSAWYLLARGEGDALVAFSHFRFDLDSDLPVLYW